MKKSFLSLGVCLFAGSFALVGCNTTPKQTETEMRSMRAPASNKELSLQDPNLDGIVCTNSPTGSDDYFHYVLDLRQRKGDENGPWAWVEDGDVVVVQDYNHGAALDNYGNFLAKVELTESSLKLTGVPASTASSFYSYRKLVSKPNFQLAWTPQGGQVTDGEKARSMKIKSSAINCFQPRMQLE